MGEGVWPRVRKTPTSRLGGAAPATSSAQAQSTKARIGSSGSTLTQDLAYATTRHVSVRTRLLQPYLPGTNSALGNHGYGEQVEVVTDPTGMAYLFNGEPLVARDAKVGLYHVNVKGKHKILTRRSGTRH